MIRHKNLYGALLLAACMAFGASAQAAKTKNQSSDVGSGKSTSTGGKGGREVVEFKDSRLFIEVNATDGDAGIQAFIDVDEWAKIAVFDPNGRLMLRSVMRGAFAQQGGTELFFESAEPDFGDLPLSEFLKRFPEGKYKFRGRRQDGARIKGSTILTHNIPDGPQLLYPIEDDDPVNPSNLTLTWAPVGPANGSPIIGYRVIVAEEEPEFDALPSVALEVVLPATQTSLQVPAGYLKSDAEYEWEVLAIEEGGNQTLSGSAFVTQP